MTMTKTKNANIDPSGEDQHPLSSPFKPNLGEAFSHHPHHHEHSPEEGRHQQKTPVCDRLYEDAVHRAHEEGSMCCREKKHEPEDDTIAAKLEHVHLKNSSPFAIDLCSKADYLRRMDTSLSVDGGSIENGLYGDSSVSSASTQSTAVCECGNIIQLTIDLEKQVHPSDIFVSGDGESGQQRPFSPNISETQKVVASPCKTNKHAAKESRSVFDRLYHDKEQRQRRLTMEKNRVREEEDKELTFHPRTNIKHKKKKRRSREPQQTMCDQCMRKRGTVQSNEKAPEDDSVKMSMA